MRKKIIDNIKTLFYALIIALFIRSLFYNLENLDNINFLEIKPINILININNKYII